MAAARMLGRAVLGSPIWQNATPSAIRFVSTTAAKHQMWRKPLQLVAGVAVVGGVCGLTFKKVHAAATPRERTVLPFEIQNDDKVIIDKGSNREVTSFDWQNIEYPNVPISRSVSGTNKLEGIRLTLFQYQTCPFCCKVRAFLDYMDIPYDVVEVEPVLRQQIKFSQYKKVPILLVREDDNCWQLNDSTVIISILQSFLLDQSSGIRKYLDLYKPIKSKDFNGKEVTEVYNKYNIMFGQKAPKSSIVSKEIEWRKWTDDVLVHVLSPNVYRTREEALQAFNYFSDVGGWEKLFPAWERYLVIYVGATAMYFVGKRLKKKYNLKDDVRISFYDECDRWVRNLGSNRFAGGEKPNLADLAVFGVLNSVEGCLAFSDVLKYTKIQRWYEDMRKETRKD